MSNDPVNHPAHYTNDPAKCSECGAQIECIDITRHRNFNIGNAIKYLWRHGMKGDNPIQDLQKAIWYITDEIKMLDREAGGTGMSEVDKPRKELEDLRRAIALAIALEGRDVDHTNMKAPIVGVAEKWGIQKADARAVDDWDMNRTI